MRVSGWKERCSFSEEEYRFLGVGEMATNHLP
jgi:hypothetical protein